MADINFIIDIQRLRSDLIKEIITELNNEFASIIQILKSNLDMSKTISLLPDHWVSDVVEHLRYIVRDDSLADMICGTIGVFDSDNGTTVERPQDVLWKAMIINYGMGVYADKENEYLSEYESSSDFNTQRTELSPKYNIITRHDSYYDPELKRYVEPDTAMDKKDKLIPQFSHKGNFWWSDAYAKFLDLDGKALTMVDDLIDRIENRIDWQSYLSLNGYLDVTL